MDASYMNTDMYTGCTIRGLPIGLPFRTKIQCPEAKGMEYENVVGVFIISAFRNEHDNRVIQVLSDHIDSDCVKELKALDVTENRKNVECRCHLQLDTQDKIVQVDIDDNESPQDVDTSMDSCHVKIEKCNQELPRPVENMKCFKLEVDHAGEVAESVRCVQAGNDDDECMYADHANSDEDDSVYKSKKRKKDVDSDFGPDIDSSLSDNANEEIKPDDKQDGSNINENVRQEECTDLRQTIKSKNCMINANIDKWNENASSKLKTSASEINDERPTLSKNDRITSGLNSKYIDAYQSDIDEDDNSNKPKKRKKKDNDPDFNAGFDSNLLDNVNQELKPDNIKPYQSSINENLKQDKSVQADFEEIESPQDVTTSIDSCHVKIDCCSKELPQPVENMNCCILEVDQVGKESEGTQGVRTSNGGEDEYMDANQENRDEDDTVYKPKKKKNKDIDPDYDPGFDSTSSLSDSNNEEIEPCDKQDESNINDNVRQEECTDMLQTGKSMKCLISSNVDKSDENQNASLTLETHPSEVHERPTRRKSARIKSGINSKYMDAFQLDIDEDDIPNKLKKMKKNDDPDFDPSFDSYLSDNADKESMFDQNKYSPSKTKDVRKEQSNDRESSCSSDYDSESDLEDDEPDAESSKHLHKQAEKGWNKKQKEKLRKEAQKIKVKLADHPDKYRMEMMESFARKDRAKAPDECAIQVMVCTLCEKFKVEHVEKMEIHLEKHLNGELHCSDCDFIAVYSGELRTHKRNVHKPNLQICAECGEETVGKLGLKNHMGKVHNKPQFKCKHCLTEHNIEYASLTSRLRKIHIHKEHADKLFRCNNCDKLCPTQLNLKRHHHRYCHGKESKSFPCEKCGKTYAGRLRLRFHIEQVHDNIRLYPCPQCPFSACRKGVLNRHLRVHLEHHPLKCDQCSFTCVQKCQLKSHMRTHTGDKPYKCDQCRYAAAWKVQLKDHLKIHGRLNTVMCDQCNILFKDLRAFKAHVKKEHPQNDN